MAQAACRHSGRTKTAGHCYQQFVDAEPAMVHGRKQRCEQLRLGFGVRIGAQGQYWGRCQEYRILADTGRCAHPGVGLRIEEGTEPVGSNPAERIAAAAHRKPAAEGVGCPAEVVGHLAGGRQAGGRSTASWGKPYRSERAASADCCRSSSAGGWDP
jgi:hypothetical protein